LILFFLNFDLTEGTKPTFLQNAETNVKQKKVQTLMPKYDKNVKNNHIFKP